MAGLRISGTYRLDDTDQILRALTTSLPVQVQVRTRFWVTHGGVKNAERLITLPGLIRLIGIPTFTYQRNATMTCRFNTRPFTAPGLRTCLLLRPALLAGPAAASAAQAHDYHLPQGDLGETLTQFVAESGIVLSFDTHWTRGKRSPALEGR